MNKFDLNKLSKSKLIKMLLKQEPKSKPKTKTPKNMHKTKPIKEGWECNPLINRLIKINGPTYKKLYPLKFKLNIAIEKDKEVKK